MKKVMYNTEEIEETLCWEYKGTRINRNIKDM